MSDTNIQNQYSRKDLVLAARGLLREWAQKKDIDKTLTNPRAEEMIIEASAELLDSDTQEEWVTLVNGDGGDIRRVHLAQRCRHRIQERDKML